MSAKQKNRKKKKQTDKQIKQRHGSSAGKKSHTHTSLMRVRVATGGVYRVRGRQRIK